MVLYQVPVVNVVLAPIIGRSTVTTVTVPVGTLVTNRRRDPQAGGVHIMVESFDGTLISTNYFPAYSVVVDGADTTHRRSSTVPAWRPQATSTHRLGDIVDGLVPGLDTLRDAGYNVVTWDPRGEFDSGGQPATGSPAYEGKDVKAIINWMTANVDYTYQRST